MRKKLLLILFISVSSIVFSQELTIEKLTAAPNPFKTQTNIAFTSNVNENVIFIVKNVLGKTVHRTTYKTKIGKNKIPFSKGNLETGIYIYSIRTKKKIISKRFVIQ